MGENSSILASEPMPRAADSILMDMTPVEGGYVAVGERGHALVSTDGESWSQSETPTRSSLTAVWAIGPEVWAAGHDAVILHSSDGGVTWARQYVAEDVNDPDLNRPLLDVFFVDSDNGFAIGAYAFYLRTRDGGETWEELDFNSLVASGDEAEVVEEESADDDGGYQDYSDFEDEFFDYHLNGMARLADGTLFIAAEMGNAFVSRDSGESWIPVMMPYEGSMFGALATAHGTLVSYGLRGNAFESRDGGESWIVLETGTLNSLFGATNGADGSLVLVGANAEFLVRSAPGSPIESRPHAGGDDIAAVAVVEDGFVIVGEEGAERYSAAGGQ
ncbi:MAG: hypothetical protein QNJ40_12305 [Xanthomonadales bacterium]|nr:hypothetical protein [Xanthomonadales bacterium]